MNRDFTCLNGQILPTADARLPVSDRGLRFGDGVFETIRLVEGVPYQWEAHLARLTSGLDALRIVPPDADWHASARQLLQTMGIRDGFLRLAVTRGTGSAGYRPLPQARANWIIEYIAPSPAPSTPSRLWLSSMHRPSPKALPFSHKLAQGVNSTLALMEATDHGCDEAILLSANGTLSCAASANLFWIKGSRMFTPSLSTGCLAGVTRATLLAARPDTVHECEAEPATLDSADAVFLTSTRLGVWPVSEIHPLGLTFATDHPAILELQQLIHMDRKSYVENNSKCWSQS